MSNIKQIILLTTITISKINAQTGGTTATGDSYVCVPPGFCNNGGAPPSIGIDPRIVTPGQLCPSGQIPCYTQGPSSRCGQRLATPPPPTADGPAVISAHPWQAYIINSTERVYAGSGVLIDNYHILTAAHKVALSPQNVNPPASVTVFMEVATAPPSVPPAQSQTGGVICVHPDFTSATLKNDIAIIKVSTPFSLSSPNINSLCLPPAGSTGAFYNGQSCIVAGWGETVFQQNDRPTNPMKQVNVLPRTDCRDRLLPVLPTVDTYFDPAGEICAGGEPQKDACTFDGGAPLTCPYNGRLALLGIVTWGKGCGQANVPGVYVNVPYYRQWIDSTITALNTKNTCT